jgi:hypothetical protein
VIDLATAQGAREWIVWLKGRAVQNWRKNGSISAWAALIATRDEDTGKAISPTEIVCILDPALFEPSEKDKLALWLRRAARMSDAIGYVLVSEIWTLDTDIRPKGSWEKVPGRKERLSLMVEHQALGPECLGFSREIMRRKKLGPWREVVLTGRFAGVLRREEETNQLERLVKALIDLSVDWTPEQRRKHCDNARARALREGGVPAHAVEKTFKYLVERLRAAGRPVAALPEDLLREQRGANDAPVVKIVNVEE